MAWIQAIGMVLSAVIGAEGAKGTSGAMEAGAAAGERTAAKSRELNIERYGEARELLDPYIGEARTAREQLMIEMGLAPGESAYMETPGYQSLLEERQAGAEQAAATSGSLYSGRRIQAAADIGGATQSQFYTNYMNLLQNMGSPSVATNVASLGVGQAATMGGQQIAAQQAATSLRVGAAETQQAFMGDVIGGAANIYSGYLSQPPKTRTQTQVQPTTQPTTQPTITDWI